MSLGIYIHIPFCLKKCGYCDFVSSCVSPVPQKEYTNSVVNEIRLVTERIYDKKARVKSIYFGGGTPSLFSPENISAIIGEIRKLYDLEDDAEITLEANPKTAGYEKLRGFRNAGINRLSIGVQSFDDNMLKILGRIHDKKAAVDMYKNARKADFDNINLDIIFGIPAQSYEMLRTDLRILKELYPEHISAYILSVEKNTPLFEKIKSNKMALPKDDVIADMFETVDEYLSDNSYDHYEISNYARRSRESVHNLNYWRYGEYLGFGAAAHSLIKDNEAAKYFLDETSDKTARDVIRYNTVRWSNITDYNAYMKNLKKGCLSIALIEPLDEKKRMSEFLMMGLRLKAGIKFNDFKKEFGKKIKDVYNKEINLLTKRGLVETKNNSLKLTQKGVLLSNEVLINLI
jgi:oxygen-independent coproporphyrinogen-3 oxidase